MMTNVNHTSNLVQVWLNSMNDSEVVSLTTLSVTEYLQHH